MKLTLTLNLSEGMRLARDVYAKHSGILIASKGSNITSSIIELINRNSIDFVFIDDGIDGDVYDSLLNLSKLRSLKDYAESEIRTLFTHSFQGNKENFIATYEELDQVVKELGKHNNLVFLMSEISNTDDYTYNHSVNVCLISLMIGKWIGMQRADQERLGMAALLHDIGKVKIPSSILNKPDKLTSNEYAIIKEHSIFGYELVKSYGIFDEECLDAVLYHHERLDGSGYPKGLKGSKIPSFARIVAIADTFDAMTSKRCYTDKYTPFIAVEEIHDCAPSKLDPVLSRVFVENISNFYLNDQVELSDGRVGEIILFNMSKPTRPIIKIEHEVLDLSKSDLSIVKIIKRS